MRTFIEFVAIGLIQGASFALLAVGLTLIYGILGVLNFAQGAFSVLGAFFVYGLMVGFGVSFGPAVIVASLAVGLVGLVMIRAILIPLFNMKAPPMSQMLATLAVGLALQRGLELVASSTPRTIPVAAATRAVSFGPVSLNEQRVTAAIVAVLLVIVVRLVIKVTPLGRQMRAVGQNRTGAVLCGVNLDRVYTVTFVLGASLAACGGALVLAAAPITPGVALDMTIGTFIVVIVGGLGSLTGATIVGLALGVVEALGAGYWDPSLAPLVGYTFMIVVLLYRPRGLFSWA
jgi:branched-chain amino acid transport system permease protein